MEFVETKLKGVFLVRQKKIADARGFFARAWCRDEFAAAGLSPTIIQINTAFSTRAGTVRGMHFQADPHAEAKFIRCTRGAIFDVAVDLRAGSPTRGQWVGAELSADNGEMLYIPEGFAHGYQTLSDDTEMYYTTSAVYAPKSAGGYRYNDAAFGITWPLPVSVISDADAKWPDYAP